MCRRCPKVLEIGIVWVVFMTGHKALVLFVPARIKLVRSIVARAKPQIESGDLFHEPPRSRVQEFVSARKEEPRRPGLGLTQCTVQDVGLGTRTLLLDSNIRSDKRVPYMFAIIRISLQSFRASTF